jgi:rhamnulokinase
MEEKGSRQWHIAALYQEVMAGLREAGHYEEPVQGISCSSWGSDYLLFEEDGSLSTPMHHFADSRNRKGREEALSRASLETIFDETGVNDFPSTTLYQLASEKSRRLKRARHCLPFADGFNFLMSGVPWADMSLASATGLFNPVTRTWSDRLISALKLPRSMFPTLVSAGTRLGALQQEIARDTRLGEAQVITGCSHELAAALFGLPVAHGESWAFLRSGSRAEFGTELIGPIINDTARELRFTNEMGYGGAVHFYRHAPGLWMLEECKRFWREKDRELGEDVLAHLATSADPFESLIDPSDARFAEPGDMPLKIQAFCKDTDQPVPRKPGPILRCVLESLALSYRKALHELENLTGREFTRLYLLGGSSENLLYHFTANALQLPVVLVPPHAAAIGNMLVQAIALGHVRSVEQAREIISHSFPSETITPHAAVWNAAYYRLSELVPS